MLHTALASVLVLFGTSVAVIALSQRLRIPPIIGFLITGMAAGPYGFAFISNERQVNTIAELGIVFLLFLVGLELSLTRLKQLGRIIVIG
ncbi:MAG: cation:proton antiporter, partial [Fibrobacteres bacterium]|nr:cation:proton antiporter [Fibrobacterota bacterium]